MNRRVTTFMIYFVLMGLIFSFAMRSVVNEYEKISRLLGGEVRSCPKRYSRNVDSVVRETFPWKESLHQLSDYEEVTHNDK